MIKNSKMIYDIFMRLYKTDGIKTSLKNSFNYVMKSNESRLDYLNRLFRMIKNCELNEACLNVFCENIDFLYCFLSGEYSFEKGVSKRYFDDKEDCLIVPNVDELEDLFKLIEYNKMIYDYLYRDKRIMIELPQKSFNQNMTRILEIKEHNLAHLLGLTDSEPIPDDNKNILRKYFMEYVENNEKYGNEISVRLLNWLLSDEGKNEIRKLNKITIDFINEDKKKFPNSYDLDGNIKQQSLKEFKKRFKDENGFGYPIIKYSRYITKCINTFNFFHMNNISQMILDYNALNGKKNEKDIFIVNSLLFEDIEQYIKLNNEILNIMTEYGDNGSDEKKQMLLEKGIKVADKDILSFINLIQSYDFVGNHGIKPNQNIALEKIRNALSGNFNRNISLIGFGTEFNNQIIKLNDKSVNIAHCDTSISLTAPELVDEYYRRGRPCFLDTIYDVKDGGVLRISIPSEEIKFLEQIMFLEPNNFKYTNRLKKKLEKFKQNYFDYKNTLGDGKNKRR